MQRADCRLKIPQCLCYRKYGIIHVGVTPRNKEIDVKCGDIDKERPPVLGGH